MNNQTFQNHEDEYRDLFKSYGEHVITLADLFKAVNETPNINAVVTNFLAKTTPISVLIEGSVYVPNLDVIDGILSPRENSEDRILLIDVSPTAVIEHANYIKQKFPYKAYEAKEGTMNDLPLKDQTIDLVINDCAVNFNNSVKENEKTVNEIKRVLKPDGLCLFSVCVVRDYDSPKFGNDQELVIQDEWDQPGSFQSFKVVADKIELLNIVRKCWPVPYYENLFKKAGFNFIKFDVDHGRTFFPPESRMSFRRYLLSK